MGRVSSVKRLPPEIVEQINILLTQGRTLDEIKEALNPLLGDAAISRSALGRYKKSLAKISEKIQSTRSVAEALVRRFGDAPESKSAQLNIELMHSMVMDVIMAAEAVESGDAEGESINPMSVMLLSKALDHLSKARKADTDYILKIQEQMRKEADSKVEEAIKQAGSQAAGLDGAQALEKVRAIYRGEL
ncbi:MAG: DUF3486 family protein [Desulfarculales bacterium]|jgi:hypothetical protein|nr:DUF3486 family protein [Desulfarculales bacterium]